MKQKMPKKFLILSVLGVVAFVAILAWFFSFGDNYELVRSVFFSKNTSEQMRDKLQDMGLRGQIAVGVLSMLQVILAFLPAEPVQMLAGLSFGFWQGLLICAAGVLVGNLVIYLVYRLFGNQLRHYFVSNLKVNLDRAATSDKVVLIVLILYCLPAIPYGMICFFAASTGMKYPRYATVTLLGSLPSICIGVGIGNMAVLHGWVISTCVFLLLVALLVIAMINREALFGKLNAYIEKHQKKSAVAKKIRPHHLLPAYVISRLLLWLRGVKVRTENRVGKELQTPCVVLCNHGSFIDFIYAGGLLRRHSPNFIVARLYFYRSDLAALLRAHGCFPKSMFTLDYESVKNSMTVLKRGGMLAMMPEARLSTAGRFEDIQPGTYSFLQKMGVPVYTVKIHGDYFADPKWGRGFRRGALVEATLDSLLSAEQVKTMTPEQIGQAVEQRLYYDEFAWLKTRPRVRYRSKKLAEGLENILTTCPRCHGKYTLTTKGRDVICDTCGKVATMDDRYSFVDGAPFENFSHWYDWQLSELKREIEGHPEYALTSRVTLRRPSTDGKTMLREAGEGVCTLTREGLTYHGTQDGETFDFSVSLDRIYRLLFGAGENFEVYVGKEIYYFVPEDRRSAVEWYMASMILWDEAHR